MKAHHWAIALLAIVIIILLAFLPEALQNNHDELTGSWRGGGVSAEGYEWYMIYDFDNGKYTLETDSGYSENGTYKITKRFDDGSITVEKTFYNGEKIFEMSIILDENQNSMTLEGVRMERQR
jgi:hypothetical protein